MSKAFSLTPTQKEVLDFVRKYIDERDGVAPSTDEIAEAVKCSRSSAHKLLKALEQRGHIEKIPRGHRAIRILSIGNEKAETKPKTSSLLDD